MGDNQHRHLLVKNLLIANEKPYPNLMERKKEIYEKSQWKAREFI